MGDEQQKNDTVVARKPRKARFLGRIVMVGLLLAACFGAGIGGTYVALQYDLFGGVTERGTVSDGNLLSTNEEDNIAAVAEKLGPSVVSVITTDQQHSLFDDQIEQGAGSGIILSSDGWILTNKHVVKNTSKLTVITSDGTEYSNVRVVGTDPFNDLAFLKVSDVKNWKPAKLGDSSTVRIGQKVIAIGNSLGEFQNTVTSGIISGRGRAVAAQEGKSLETLNDLLQTDTAINPGNSGGPLVNLSGQVIGVNTAIAEDAQSIGFSIPINMAKGIIKQIEKTGKVTRAYIGLSFIAINPEVAKEYGLSVKEGAYVIAEGGSAVIDGGPAGKAGVKDRDIITKVNKLVVGKHGSLTSLVSEYAVGDTVELTLLRNGQEMKLRVTLEKYGG
jgi:serine protease Do